MGVKRGSMTDIVGKLWGFCHTLRHDGIDYGDYIEQLTYLLFLKMIEEKGAEIPSQYSWPILREKSGTELTDHYQATLKGLGEQPGMLDEAGGRWTRQGDVVHNYHFLDHFVLVLGQHFSENHHQTEALGSSIRKLALP